MLSLEEASAAILGRIRICGEVEEIPLRQALGRFVAKELCARVDNPAFTNSAMDGYALSLDDLVAAGFELPPQGESRCGDVPGTLTRGTTMRIFTGAPLPEGADAIVIQEDIRLERGKVVFPRSVQPGQNLRLRAEDFRAGDGLYAPGRRLTAYDLALLSSAGVDRIPVYPRARALVVATGDELVAPGTPLKPGQIYESNRLATLLQLEALGVEVTDGGTVPDDAMALRALLKTCAAYDFVVTSGGASVGDHDIVRQVFSEIGDIDFWRARIKPGKPLAFGRLGERGHFFALPGNPVSSLVTLKLFVEPAVLAWNHAMPGTMPEFAATAGNGLRRHPGRTEFVRARLHLDHKGRLIATVLRGQGSHQIGTLRDTNGLIKVAEDSPGFEQGDAVIVIPLGLDRL
ncbi:MAG: molybdopterin molybdotransferase MoeA [Acidiferrobacterales bacterium]